ncbi:hypothetical protein Anapl_02789 [Anas platyrhynchos]|uniref:Uncharacterized protein n=1 Tax=Anas platyrhynchos TaxID=8839 RepID=R0K4H0_ANAPL|nr:hypothetical protein Anapl_02789 [Anas platyrhynchos]
MTFLKLRTYLIHNHFSFDRTNFALDEGMQSSMQKLQFAQRARMNAGEEDNRLAVIPSSSHTDVQDSTCGCHMSSGVSDVSQPKATISHPSAFKTVRFFVLDNLLNGFTGCGPSPRDSLPPPVPGVGDMALATRNRSEQEGCSVIQREKRKINAVFTFSYAGTQSDPPVSFSAWSEGDAEMNQCSAVNEPIVCQSLASLTAQLRWCPVNEAKGCRKRIVHPVLSVPTKTSSIHHSRSKRKEKQQLYASAEVEYRIAPLTLGTATSSSSSSRSSTGNWKPAIF